MGDAGVDGARPLAQAPTAGAECQARFGEIVAAELPEFDTRSERSGVFAGTVHDCDVVHFHATEYLCRSRLRQLRARPGVSPRDVCNAAIVIEPGAQSAVLTPEHRLEHGELSADS
jgi:hypothetical protein